MYEFPNKKTLKKMNTYWKGVKGVSNIKTIKEYNAYEIACKFASNEFLIEDKFLKKEDVLELINGFSKKRLYRSKSCQLLARRLKARIEG